MTQPANASEPSMEEILASIRRIIADDDTHGSGQPEPEVSRIAAAAVNPAAPRPIAPAGDSFAEQSADVRDLSEAMSAAAPQSAAAPTGPMPPLRASDGACDFGVADAAEKSAARGRRDEARLFSRETSAAVDAAFNALAQTVRASNARTLEDLVREMLRPMLTIWLDENLPRLVEQLVRAEIERVSRGR